jgi:hypothetical protein
MLQPDGLKFSHKTQLYMTPQLVQTVKTFNFLPWRSYKSMTEEAAEEEYYQHSTVKMTADVCKHQAAA